MSQAIKILFGGFAIFSMFFGSGNLVFSIMIGALYPDQWLWGAFGFLLSGALLPLLGLVFMAVIAGDQKRCYAWFGLRGAFLIQLFLVLLLGPLGIAPRSLSVASGAWTSVLPDFPVWLFLILCTGILAWASFGKRPIVEIIAKYFSPIKVGCLGFVLVSALLVSVYIPPSLPEASAGAALGGLAPIHTQSPALDAFHYGILCGYQTMDLLAALFFGTIIVMYFSGTVSHQRLPKQVFKHTIYGMGIGMGILSIAYCILLYLGTRYAHDLASQPPTQMLPRVVELTLGGWAEWIVSITIIVSCLTTALALFSASLQFLSERVSFFEGHRTKIWLVSLVCMCAVAYTGFSTIVKYLGAVLEVIYPLFIILVVGKLIQELYLWRRERKSQAL